MLVRVIILSTVLSLFACNQTFERLGVVRSILEQEIQGVGTLNANLGCFTNFVNFLGMCGVSVPAGTFESDLSSRVRPEDGDASCVQVPFGITLLGKAWEDALIGDIAMRYTNQ